MHDRACMHLYETECEDGKQLRSYLRMRSDLRHVRSGDIVISCSRSAIQGARPRTRYACFLKLYAETALPDTESKPRRAEPP